jgi:hypothetical protein
MGLAPDLRCVVPAALRPSGSFEGRFVADIDAKSATCLCVACHVSAIAWLPDGHCDPLAVILGGGPGIPCMHGLLSEWNVSFISRMLLSALLRTLLVHGL